MLHTLIGAYVGKPLEALPTPALVLDAVLFEKNLQNMAELCAARGLALRPHIKSHKCPTIAHMQMRHGAIGICTATLGETEVMAYAGVDHILLTSEIVDAGSITRLVHLAQGRDIMVAIAQVSIVQSIAKAANELGVCVGIIADLDVGMHRGGASTYEQLYAVATTARDMDGVEFRGVMGYEGHMALTPDKAQRVAGGQEATQILIDMVERLRSDGIQVPIVTGGGTGTYQHYMDMPNITEIEAGSYIFMDKTYSNNLGNDDFAQALHVLGTVIHRTEKEMIINVGLKAISPERSAPDIVGAQHMKTEFIHEEHMKVSFDSECPFQQQSMVFVTPSHCCTTVNLYDVIFVYRNGIVEAVWPILARRV